MKSFVRKVPENRIVKTTKNPIKKYKFQNQREGSDGGIRSLKNTIKQDKFKNQRKESSECLIPKTVLKSTLDLKTRNESLKIRKTKSGSTEPTKLKKLKEDGKSITAKTRIDAIKPKQLKKQTEKTRSECIKLSKKHTFASEHTVEEANSSFRLAVPLAYGEFCFQQKETNEDNQLVILYENRREQKINNMAPDEVNEEQKKGEEKMNNMAPDEANGEQKKGEEKMNNMAPDEVNEELKKGEEKMYNLAPDEADEEQKKGEEKMNNMAPDEVSEEQKKGEKKMNNMAPDEANEEQKGPEDEDGRKEIEEPPQKIEIKSDVLNGMFDRIERCYSVQEMMYEQIRLLEKSRYEIHLEVVHKDDIIEDLHKKINALQSELHIAVEEKMECQLLLSQMQHPPMCRKQLCENFATEINEIGSSSEVREQLLTKETQTDGLVFDPEYKTLQEQYCSLQNDYHNKVTEVSSIWSDLMSLNQETNKQCLLLKETEAVTQNMLEASKCLEIEKHKLLLYKDQCIDLEQQRNLAKQKLRAFEEECNNARQILADQTAHLVSDRNKAKEDKYLEEIMGLKIELQDVQSKLEDKTHLHSIALDEITELSKKTLELITENDKLKVQLSTEEKVDRLFSKLETTEKKLEKLEEVQLENTRLRSLTNLLESVQTENNHKFEEQVQENRQLMTQLETEREESIRQIAVVEDRYETVKKSMQAQIKDMETELIQSQAALCTAKNDKDEIHKKMRLQIMNLYDNLNAVQTNIDLLLNHVVHLKTSRTQYLKTGSNHKHNTQTQKNPLCSSLSNNDKNTSMETPCGS